MRRFVVFLVVLGLVFVAWSATASAAGKARPFQGYMIGTATFTPGADSPTGVWAQPYGVGDVSHLGASVMTAKHPADLTFKDGEMTIVAANGDKVYLQYIGGGPAPEYMGQVYDVLIKFTIVGGTGRFTGASGGGDMTVTLTFMGFDLSTGSIVWPEVCTWRNGTIKY
jgi:hypothetical protein